VTRKKSTDLPGLPRWAQLQARRAARYAIHPTGDQYKAAQRRVRTWQAARRAVIEHTEKYVPLLAALSDIDRHDFRKACTPLVQLISRWHGRLNQPSPAAHKGRPRTTADRYAIFHGIVERLVNRDESGWDRTTAWQALARFVVAECPPGRPDGSPAYPHLYRAKYCSNRCHAAARRARPRPSRAQPPDSRTRACVVCGRSFAPARVDAACCSGRCRIARWRHRSTSS
jgi:hypothetical protein